MELRWILLARVCSPWVVMMLAEVGEMAWGREEVRRTEDAGGVGVGVLLLVVVGVLLRVAALAENERAGGARNGFGVDEHTDDGLVVAEEASYSESDELADESSESNDSDGDRDQSMLICR